MAIEKAINEMNVYSKLLHCRAELKGMDIRKSGYNSHAKYKYYELKDFLGPIMDLCLSYNLFTEISFNNEMATLTITNIDKTDEKIIFTSPMSTAKLPACHEVQNLGAVETYERRYLYVTAFEIIEPDVLDATTTKDKEEEQTVAGAPPKGRKLSDKQVNRLFAIAKGKGYTEANVLKAAKAHYNAESISELTKQQYDEMCNGYEAAAPKQ